MPGAPISNKRFKRLLRLITLRYKSFKSDVAKRPPGNGTNGLKSGGNTGRTVITICSGLLPELLKDSSICKRLSIFLDFASDVTDGNASRIMLISSSISMFLSINRIASPPISAVKSSPYVDKHSWYSSSVRIWPLSRSVMPPSMTI